MSNRINFILVILILFSCQDKSIKNEHTTNEKASTDKIEANNLSHDNKDISASVAVKFINDYIVNENLQNQSVEITQWVNNNSLVTQAFKTELQRIVSQAGNDLEEGGLDFDPIFDAQDYPEEGVELESIDTNTGYVTVTGKKWKEFKVNLKILEIKGKWLVDGAGMVNIPETERAPR